MTKVHLYKSPVSRPANFALHCWFVIEEQKQTQRWEIWNTRNRCKTSWEFLHKNILPIHKGMGVWCWQTHTRFEGTLWRTFNEEESLRLKKVLQSSPKEYYYQSQYRYIPGPNSNTYIQWVLKKANVTFKLPWNAIGKDYPLRNS